MNELLLIRTCFYFDFYPVVSPPPPPPVPGSGLVVSPPPPPPPAPGSGVGVVSPPPPGVVVVVLPPLVSEVLPSVVVSVPVSSVDPVEPCPGQVSVGELSDAKNSVLEGHPGLASCPVTVQMVFCSTDVGISNCFVSRLAWMRLIMDFQIRQRKVVSMLVMDFGSS